MIPWIYIQISNCTDTEKGKVKRWMSSWTPKKQLDIYLKHNYTLFSAVRLNGPLIQDYVGPNQVTKEL
jgi:hypothetical protein